jgi:hypothetical protein
MTEAFTRLTPAPEVTLDKEKYAITLHLLALRVPKVSTHPTSYVNHIRSSAAAAAAASQAAR